MIGAVVALGITQITAWGTSYYCLGVLAGPIGQDTGWSRGFVFLGFTVALLVMGVVSKAVGLPLHGLAARPVVTLATGLVATALSRLPLGHGEAAPLPPWASL